MVNFVGINGLKVKNYWYEVYSTQTHIHKCIQIIMFLQIVTVNRTHTMIQSSYLRSQSQLVKEIADFYDRLGYGVNINLTSSKSSGLCSQVHEQCMQSLALED